MLDEIWFRLKDTFRFVVSITAIILVSVGAVLFAGWFYTAFGKDSPALTILGVLIAVSLWYFFLSLVMDLINE